MHRSTQLPSSCLFLPKKPLPGNISATTSVSRRSHARRHRSSSSRGKFNTPYTQFADATRFILNIFKYLAIIWGLVLVIYLLFQYASTANWQTPHTTPDTAEAKLPETLPASANATSGVTQQRVTANDNPSPKSLVAGYQPQAVLKIAAPEPDIASSPATAPPPAAVLSELAIQSGENAATTTNSTRASYKVTAYKAMLFDSIDSDESIKTPLEFDSVVSFIDRQGEWIKVITTDTGKTGFVHVSQVREK